MKPGTVLILVGIIGCMVAGGFLVKRKTAPEAPPRQAARANAGLERAAGPEARMAAPTAPEPAGAEVGRPARQRNPEPRPAALSVQNQARPPGGPGKNQGGGQKNTKKEEIADPLARVALSFVGADSEADAYWYAAINDPSLSAHERQDLIEDLNEDGLSDPRRPSLEDLPLVLSRLELIAEVAPGAMDQVNADAFAEAYKDLWNMASRLMGAAGPSR
jgi:hypothetical protein